MVTLTEKKKELLQEPFCNRPACVKRQQLFTPQRFFEHSKEPNKKSIFFFLIFFFFFCSQSQRIKRKPLANLKKLQKEDQQKS